MPLSKDRAYFLSPRAIIWGAGLKRKKLINWSLIYQHDQGRLTYQISDLRRSGRKQQVEVEKMSQKTVSCLREVIKAKISGADRNIKLNSDR